MNTFQKKCFKKFNGYFSLKKPSKYTVDFIELDKSALEKVQQSYADMLLRIHNDDKEESFGFIVFYGYRLGALRIKGENECYSKQIGYKDETILPYDLSDILDKADFNENMDVAASDAIEWLINPEDSTEYAEDVFRKMTVPVINSMCKSIPTGRQPKCTIVLPPFSATINQVDWSEIFSKVRMGNLKINLTNYSYLYRPEEGERKYIFQHQTDGKREYVILSAYEEKAGKIICCGSLAFDAFDLSKQYKLQEVTPLSFHKEPKKEKMLPKKAQDENRTWKYCECKYPINIGFNSFLSSHEASFDLVTYVLAQRIEEMRSEELAIKELFGLNESVPVSSVCARLLKEKNLYNIALGDMVYVANILEQSSNFQSTMLGTKHKYALGMDKNFAADVDISTFCNLPSNYSTFEWKLRESYKQTVDYFELDGDKHSERQIIESIVNHYRPCTTAMVAEDLLYSTGNKDVPNALYTAKVFMVMSKMDSLVIDSHLEEINDFESVDHMRYQEIKVEVKKENKKTQNEFTTLAVRFKETEPQNKKNNVSVSGSVPVEGDSWKYITIQDASFNVRTYNCLKRAGYKTLGEISEKTEKDLYKVRNLGKRGVEEIKRKLNFYGCKIRKE